MITPASPQRRRTVRLPRSLPRSRPIAEPISTAHAGFFGGAGFYVRVGVLAAVALGAFAILALRLWSLQVLQGPRYEHLAQRQTFRYVDLPAPRAPIVDARGRTLAATEGRLVLTADPESLGSDDGHHVWRPSPHGRRLLAQVARLGDVGVGKLVERIRASRIRSPYAPAVILPRLTRSLSLYLDERAADFPGLHVAALPVRSYPQGALGSEFLGLLGEVSQQQLGQPAHRGARPGELIGQSGVEASYDRILNGGLERDRVAVDSLGRAVGPLRPIQRHVPRHGLAVTIDARLQRAAERAIRDGIAYAHAAGHWDAAAGAAVVMNPRTGALYALASYPSFNQVAAADDPEYLARLLDPKNPAPSLFNRATQGLYPTGSTFKPIVAEAALASGLITPYSVLPCTGSLVVGNMVFHNVEPGINASLTLPQALSISCDTWFYRLGQQFYWRQQQGRLDLQRWAKLLGLGHRTGIDLPGEAAGVVPTPAWLKSTFSAPWQRIWYEGYSVNLSIGQGYLAVTPLQLAVAYAALANGGTVVRPHLGRALVGASGHVLGPLGFPPRARLKLKDVWAIREGLFDAAHDPNGTSAAIFGTYPVPIAGKTGTAQSPPGSDHSWYASWAPVGNPRVVVVVLIEHGGFGAEAAAPAAREIYDAFFRIKPGG